MFGEGGITIDSSVDHPVPGAGRKSNRRLTWLAGCLTFIAGFVVIQIGAPIALRNEPEDTEVFEALYWDGIRVDWCCGGGCLTIALALIVMLIIANRTRRRGAEPGAAADRGNGVGLPGR